MNSIRTTVEYEVVNRSTGPSRVCRDMAIIRADRIVLLGGLDSKIKAGTRLVIRCHFKNEDDAFIALATVKSSNDKQTRAVWSLLESDRMQLETALEAEAVSKTMILPEVESQREMVA